NNPAAATSAASSGASAGNSSGQPATAGAAGPEASSAAAAEPAESSSRGAAWGLGALIIFALAVAAYLFRRRPEPLALDDAPDTSPAADTPPPPLKVDFNL